MILVPDGLLSLVQPWSDLYAGSIAVSASVEFLHLAGLLVAGGFALSFDRAALRVFAGTVAQRTSFLAELTAVHRPVLLGLLVVVISGLALLLSDLETFLPSTIFWFKMGMLLLLLINGAGIRRAGTKLRRDALDVPHWRALKRGSLRSIALWIVLLLLGVVLTTAA
ncbi:MAG: hypothetical protein ACREL7_18130 [Longimicrobiales bacterium]